MYGTKLNFELFEYGTPSATGRQPQISHYRRNPKHINEYGTMHHFIHVLQRGKVICASHIAVFETIVKNLLRQRNLPKATGTTSCSRKATTDQSLSPQSKAHHEYGHECIIHSCINVRVYKGRLPQATTLRYLKPLSRICRQGLPPVRRNPFLGTRFDLRPSANPFPEQQRTAQNQHLRQPQISHCRRNPKHINEYGYECIISFMYKR